MTVPVGPSGTNFGPYRVEERIGVGGMGEVYRALDTRLDRVVAVKVLPLHLAHNLEFRRRFDREARVLASISHPNICALFDVGRHNDVSYLVMEYLDGETVAKRLQHGPLPLREALRIAIEAASALAQAHQCGVVHRDLKPANVMLTRKGAKLLDFGLARDVSTAVAGLPSDDDDTLDRPLTSEGTIIGTFNYLSPEQVLGRDADVRSDVFAFGALLHEMVTGRRAFPGEKPASVIAAVLERQPEPLRSLRPEAPDSLQATVGRCMEKDPERRWHCFSDLLQELRRIEESPGDRRRKSRAEGPRQAPRLAREAAGWAAAGLVLALFGGWQVARPRTPPPVVHSSIVAPDGARFAFVGDRGGPAVLSPDGRSLAFVAAGEGGENRLFVQPLASGLARPLPDTADATFPFWSPDGSSLAFFAGTKLKRIEIEGAGPSVDICSVGYARGGSWGTDGVIVVATDWNQGLSRVDARGGPPAPITFLDRSKHTTHRWPFILPDGRHFLYLAANSSDEASEEHSVYFASLDGVINKPLVHSDGGALFAGGHFLYADSSQLFARPFDPGSGEFLGEAVVVAQDVVWDLGIWRAVFSASDSVLAYQSGADASSKSQLEWLDRAGTPLGVVGDKGVQFTARLAPDARLVASEAPANGSGADVWITDVGSGVRRHLTHTGDVSVPVWSRDGRWIYYTRNRKSGQRGIFRRLTSGGDQQEELMLPTETTTYVSDVSPSGDVVFQRDGDVWILPPGPGGIPPRRLLGSAASESEAQISSNGRWIAYTSNESGRIEVHVAAFPGLAHKWQLSRAGGSAPRWRADGRELFFVSSRDSMVTSVELEVVGDALRIREIKPLFRANPRAVLTDNTPYDVTGDGQRFLFNSAEHESRPITLIQSWRGKLRP